MFLPHGLRIGLCRTKTGPKVTKQLKDIEGALPFKLVAINSDSGSEFLNNNVLKFTSCGNRVVEFTRSRPYKKNDNCYVEQKTSLTLENSLVTNALMKRLLLIL